MCVEFILYCIISYLIDVDWEDLYEEMKRKSSAQLSQATADLTATIFANGEMRMEECSSALFDEF